MPMKKKLSYIITVLFLLFTVFTVVPLLKADGNGAVPGKQSVQGDSTILESGELLDDGEIDEEEIELEQEEQRSFFQKILDFIFGRKKE